MPTKHNDLDEASANGATFIVKDERSALKLKREETREAEAKYKAIVAREKEASKAARDLRREEIKLELTKLKLNQSASEKARGVIAAASPWMVCFICGGFVLALSTGKIPDEATATSSALITLVMTGLLANLRSIISEGSQDTKATEDTPKPKTK